MHDRNAPLASEPADRLDLWKQIAAYLNRHVSTVQRWEKSEGMPVHRHLHGTLGSAYAYRSELDAWRARRARRRQLSRPAAAATAATPPAPAAPPASVGWLLAAALSGFCLGSLLGRLRRPR
jgi:hypothetical protein